MQLSNVPSAWLWATSMPISGTTYVNGTVAMPLAVVTLRQAGPFIAPTLYKPLLNPRVSVLGAIKVIEVAVELVTVADLLNRIASEQLSVNVTAGFVPKFV